MAPETLLLAERFATAWERFMSVPEARRFIPVAANAIAEPGQATSPRKVATLIWPFFYRTFEECVLEFELFVQQLEEKQLQPLNGESSASID